MTTPAFGGEVSELRSGYSPEVADALATTFALTRDDVVLDSATAPASSPGVLAPRVGAVLGMDPVPAMLDQAARTPSQQRVTRSIPRSSRMTTG
ncbi:hypothetical protein [Amycolatopsis sp. NPDC004378]